MIHNCMRTNTGYIMMITEDPGGDDRDIDTSTVGCRRPRLVQAAESRGT